MNVQQAGKILNSLANENRINIFKLLIKHKEIGIFSGKIGELLNIPQNTTSFHLKNLKNSNLIFCKKEGKYCKYFLNEDTTNSLKQFLFTNYCNEPDIIKK